MNEKTPVTLDAATAAAFAGTVYAIGIFQEQILDVLGRARLEAIETHVKATLDGRLTISQTNEDFLREVVAVLADYQQKMADARLPVARPSVSEEPAAGSVTALADVFAAITDPVILALSKMIALDVFLGALDAEVSRSIAPKKRKEVKGRASAMAVGALDQPIGLSMNLTINVIERIIASLEIAKTQIGVHGQEIELAAMVKFARALSSGCRHKCSKRVGRGIVFDVKESAQEELKDWSPKTGDGDSAHRLKLILKIIPLAVDVKAYLEEVSAPQPVQDIHKE